MGTTQEAVSEARYELEGRYRMTGEPAPAHPVAELAGHPRLRRMKLESGQADPIRCWIRMSFYLRCSAAGYSNQIGGSVSGRFIGILVAMNVSHALYSPYGKYILDAGQMRV